MKTRALIGEILRLILITLVVVGVMWYFQRKTDDKLADYFKDNNFKTDTLVIKEEYRLPQTRVEYTLQPYTVYQYQPFDTTLIKNILIQYADSLIRIMDNNTGEVTEINPDFLKLYPKNPKLIYGSFNRDSIRLDLLNLSGEIFTQVYPTDFNRYSYVYQNGKMGLNFYPELPHFQKKFQSSLYTGVGYDLFAQSPLISGSYNIGHKRFQIRAQSDLLIQSSPELRGSLYLNYRLNK